MSKNVKAIGPTIRVDVPVEQTIRLYEPKDLVTVHFGKLPITIEYPRGSYRTGFDKEGNEWKRKMYCHYGFVPKSVGEDDEEVDVYLGEHLTSRVYIVTQVRQDTGAFDEFKCMLGFQNREEAEAMYRKHFPENWKIGDIFESTVTDLKKSINELMSMVKTLEPVAHLNAFLTYLGQSERKGADLLKEAVLKRRVYFCSRYLAQDQARSPERRDEIVALMGQVIHGL